MELVKMERGRTPCRGFTLVETLIALSVLAIGLLGMSAMQLQALEYANRGRHSTHATTVAESRLEQLMRARWTTIAPTSWTAPIAQANSVQAGGTVTEQIYNVSWRITDLVVNVTRNIDVRVTWTEPSGRTRVYALSSTRFNHEGL